jgi:hypothetical protein
VGRAHLSALRALSAHGEAASARVHLGQRGQESVVKIELTARGKQTELVLTHEELPTVVLAEDPRGGWSQFLDSLVELLR